jgi:hypothetical protein
MAGSVQVGGMMAQAKVRPSFLMAAGSFGWALALIGMAWGGILAAPAMVAAALIMGLPVGVIMSLPAQALRPENRSVGMGLFYTWLYIGHALIPPAAGWLRDATASVAAPFLISAGLVGLMPLLFGVFHMGLSVPSRTDAA